LEFYLSLLKFNNHNFEKFIYQIRFFWTRKIIIINFINFIYLINYLIYHIVMLISCIFYIIIILN